MPSSACKKKKLWSYFINEHIKRALGTRYPPDYEAVPLLLLWALHLVWFFPWSFFIFFFNDTATTEIYTLSLHDALPISGPERGVHQVGVVLEERLARLVA